MKKLFLPIFSLLLLSLSLRAQISVQSVEGMLPQALVDEYFAAPGIELSNAKYINSSGVINSNRIATFTNGPAFNVFQFSEGIILTTNPAERTAPPPNYDDGITYTAHPDRPPTDVLLQQIAGGGIGSCSFLEFDFVCSSAAADFEYVFASEEYPRNTCSRYADVFAFFVTGPDPARPQNIVTRNAALIPGTNLPVGINTVNQGFPGDFVPNPHLCVAPSGSLAYSKYYVSNMPGTPSGPYFNCTGFNGFTKGLSARVTVIPNVKYTLRISIANVSDDALCSGVFLKKKGFSSLYYELFGDITGLLDAVEGCNRVTARFFANIGDNTNTEITVTTGGTAVEGVDYQPVSRTYTMVAPQTSLDVVVNPILDGVVKEDRSVILYCHSKFYDINNAFLNDRRDTITVWIKDNDSIKLKTPPVIDAPSCGPLNAHVAIEKLKGGNNMQVKWSPQNGVSTPNSLETDLYVTRTTDYKIIAKDPYGCFTDTLQFTINIVTPPKVTLTVSPTEGCAPLTCDFTAEVTPENALFVWKMDNTEFTDSLNFSYTFMEGGMKKVILSAYEDPTCITSVEENIHVYYTSANLEIPKIDPICEEQELYVEIKDLNKTENLQVQWIPDTGVTDPASLATNIHVVKPITYMVIVEEQDGCFTDTVYVNIDFDNCSPIEIILPNIFTPNGDGYNDEFFPQIKNPEKIKDYQMYIYNRW